LGSGQRRSHDPAQARKEAFGLDGTFDRARGRRDSECWKSISAQGLYLGKIKTGTVPSIVVVPVHMKDFLALNRQQTRENAFSKTSAEDYDLDRKHLLVGCLQEKNLGKHRIPHP
jgi:hypothetical protein